MFRLVRNLYSAGLRMRQPPSSSKDGGDAASVDREADFADEEEADEACGSLRNRASFFRRGPLTADVDPGIHREGFFFHAARYVL